MFLENLLCAKQMYVMKRTCATTAPYMLFLMSFGNEKWVNKYPILCALLSKNKKASA